MRTTNGACSSLTAKSHCSTNLQNLSPATTSPSLDSPTMIRIGKRWKEYQGVSNWAGLLDPLDGTLRREILRYGQFAQAAYNCFDADPSSPSYAACRFPKNELLVGCKLSETGYKVTRDLHSTAAAEFPRWAILGGSWFSCRSAWAGYVAVCDDEAEIARLGRRDIVIALRGTITPLEWLENLRAQLTHLPCPVVAASSHNEPMVERGFWSLFTTPGVAHSSLRNQVRREIAQLLRTYEGSNHRRHELSITITGHSLGAALAVHVAYDITATFPDVPMVTVVAFGCPRVGNASFRRKLEERGSKVLRIVNTRDVVTKVPGFVLDLSSGDVKEYKGRVIPAWLLAKTGWVYADIGQELRISSRPSANVVACHDLRVYLDLVNQLRASCPFRSKVEKSSWMLAMMRAGCDQ